MSKDTGRVDHLDGLRALAIGGVLATHWVDSYLPFGSGGHIGVDLFFVLSGFIITTILWRQVDAGPVLASVGTFVARRVRRLYPALAGLVLGCVLLAALWSIGPFGAQDVAGQGMLVMAQLSWWDLSQGRFETVFGHTWSLGVEWAFYLVWPWVVLGLGRRGVPAATMARLTIALAGVTYAASFALDQYWFTFSPLGRTCGILVGAALALWMARPGRTPQRWSVRSMDAIALLVMGLFSTYVLIGFPTFDPGVRVVGLPLAIGCATYLTWFGYVREGGRVRGLLTAAPITLLGRVSYSLYLWHIPPLLLLDKDRLDLPGPVLGLMGVTFAAVATALSYVLLERPFASSRASVLKQVTSRAEPANVLARRLNSRLGE